MTILGDRTPIALSSPGIGVVGLLVAPKVGKSGAGDSERQVDEDIAESAVGLQVLVQKTRAYADFGT